MRSRDVLVALVRCLALGTVAAVVLVGCATAPAPAPAPAPSAYLVVEVSSGRAADLAPPLHENVHLVLDLTTSVQQGPGFSGRLDAAAAAREAAVEVLGTLPSESRASLRVLGLAQGTPDQCTQPLPVGGATDQPGDLAGIVPDLGGGTEAALWKALEPLDPARPRAAPLGRVVIVSDFREDCAQPQAACQMAGRLVAEGAELDLVVVGDQPLPACWRGIAAPGRAIDVAAAAAPEVRVEWTESSPTSPEARSALVPAEGRLELPAGAVRIVIGLDPPEIVGPLLLPEGTVTRVRILDFPALVPPAREVFVDMMPPPAPAATAPAEMGSGDPR